MRVLVCGSRDFTDRRIEDGVLTASVAWTLIWSSSRALVPPEQTGSPRTGLRTSSTPSTISSSRPTGPGTASPQDPSANNQEMLDEGKPDIVVAFVNKPLAESRGTADMVRRARKAGLPVYVIEAIA